MAQLGQTSLPLADGSGSLGTLGVYHELHCIVRVFLALSPTLPFKPPSVSPPSLYSPETSKTGRKQADNVETTHRNAPANGFTASTTTPT